MNPETNSMPPPPLSGWKRNVTELTQQLDTNDSANIDDRQSIGKNFFLHPMFQILVIIVGKNWIPIIARIIPGVSIPLLIGMNYKDFHAEDPDTQRKINGLNTNKIFFLQDHVHKSTTTN